MNIPKALRPYKIKISRTQTVPAARQAPNSPVDKEVMTGFVMGESASDLEERAYRSTIKLPAVTAIEFQPSFLSGRNMPGEYRLDFLVYVGGVQYPIQIDGEWIHKSAEAREEDRIKDALFDNEMIGTGALPVRRINETEIPDQEHSDRLFQEILR